MFKRANRLAKDKDIKRVFGKGRGLFTPLFSLKYIKTAGVPRFAIVISTKVSKKATVRNRLRRILRERIRKELGRIQAADYAIVLKPSAAKCGEQDLIDRVKEALPKIELVK